MSWWKAVVKRAGSISSESSNCPLVHRLAPRSASWHVLTIFGWLIAAALVWLAALPVQVQSHGMLLSAIAWTMLVSSLLVSIATRETHDEASCQPR